MSVLLKMRRSSLRVRIGCSGSRLHCGPAGGESDARPEMSTGTPVTSDHVTPLSLEIRG